MPSASPINVSVRPARSIVASKPRYLETEHETDACVHHLGGEAVKARPRDRAGARKPEILIDDNDPFLRPTELMGLAGERILPLR